MIRAYGWRRVFAFYALMSLLAVGLRFESLKTQSFDIDAPTLVWGAIFGLLGGILLVLGTLLAEKSGAGRSLSLYLRSALGELSPWAIFGLALMSSVSEELLFRWALPEFMGPTFALLLFALMHAGGGRVAWTWMALAGLAGAFLYLLSLSSGGLWAAVCAHFWVNALNLWRLSSSKRRVPIHLGPVARPIRPRVSL